VCADPGFAGGRRFHEAARSLGPYVMEEKVQSFRGIALIRIDPEPRILRCSITFSCVFNGLGVASGAVAL
jgi:hypothetical protein